MEAKLVGERPSAAATETGFQMPHTVSYPDMLSGGSDEEFRRTVYLMVLAFGRLIACREAFGRAMDLTGSQFAVLIGTAYCQGTAGVSIRALAEHVRLASTHVTTEVGRLIRKGLLTKRVNADDRRGVLVSLSRRGEAALLDVAPFLRSVNDLLFANIGRKDFDTLSQFLLHFAGNTERALAAIAQTESSARAAAHPKAKKRN